MKIIYEDINSREKIMSKAMTLCNLEKAPKNLEVLYEAAVSSSLALCGREDLPKEMELPIAIILCGLIKEGINRPVSTIKRGDVSVTYATGSVDHMEKILAPFIKLRSI